MDKEEYMDLVTRKDTQEIERIVLEKLKFGLSEHIHPVLLSKLRLSIEEDIFTKDLIARIRGFVWSKEVKKEVEETFSYPSNWWEAVKARFFPKFLKRRYPVKYKYKDVVIHHIHICPHVDFHTSFSQEAHINFLAGRDKFNSSINEY